MFVLLLISITFVSCADCFERSINRHINKFILVDDLDEYEITVLFIDEAYSLIGKNNDDYRQEAVAALLKRMEDNRERLAVIVAGYSDEMETFLNANTGLKSGFNRFINSQIIHRKYVGNIQINGLKK